MKLYEMGQQLKMLREAQKLTQAELAKECGISRVTLGKIERGELGNSSVKSLDIMLARLGYEIAFVPVQGFGLPTLDTLH